MILTQHVLRYLPFKTKITNNMTEEADLPPNSKKPKLSPDAERLLERRWVGVDSHDIEGESIIRVLQFNTLADGKLGFIYSS